LALVVPLVLAACHSRTAAATKTTDDNVETTSAVVPAATQVPAPAPTPSAPEQPVVIVNQPAAPAPQVTVYVSEPVAPAATTASPPVVQYYAPPYVVAPAQSLPAPSSASSAPAANDNASASGYTGVGAGPGYTGIGAGDGFTGFGAGGVGFGPDAG
jgi:hypothetical protein